MKRRLRDAYRIGGEIDPMYEADKQRLAANRATARPLMTDDFHYRLSKSGVDANADNIAKAYDSANMVTPKDYFDTMSLIGGDDGTSAAYTPALTKEQMQLANRRAAKNNVENPFSSEHSTLIFGREFTDDKGISPSTISHEARHMYEHELGYGVNDSNRGILEGAYPGVPEDERLTTNVEIRNRISAANNGVIKEGLDKAMDATSDADFYKAYLDANGYTKDDPYYYRDKNTDIKAYMDTDEYKQQAKAIEEYKAEEKKYTDAINKWSNPNLARGPYMRKMLKENQKGLSKLRKTGVNISSQKAYDTYNKVKKGQIDFGKELDPEKIKLLRDATKNVASISNGGFSIPRRRLESYGYETA